MWTPIPECNGYEINELGETRSNRVGNEWRPIKSRVAKVGYRMVTLPAKNKRGHEKQYIHRILAKLFIPNPDNLREVNHIDGDKTNNAFSNLEWVTHRGNMKHAGSIGLFPTGFDNAATKLSDADILEIKRLSHSGTMSQETIASQFAISQSHVHLISCGYRTSGFKSPKNLPFRKKFGNTLNPDKVREIRAMLNAGTNTQVTIAKLFGVSPALITDIKNGRCWRHV